MAESAVALFDKLTVPEYSETGGPFYVILPMSNHRNYFIGKDSTSFACFLVATVDSGEHQLEPIRLESLDVQFELLCHYQEKPNEKKEKRLTVIRCRAHDKETVRYFLTICDAVAHMLGDKPTQKAVASVVRRLASIFQKMQQVSARTVNGLFGELYLISRSTNPANTLASWRAEGAARFDFVTKRIRLDSKVTELRVRAHTFSYEQCNPPADTFAIVASMFVERSAGGESLRSLADRIAVMVASEPDLVFKLYEVIASTLGTKLKEAMDVSYDMQLTNSSLRFYNLADVPAIRGALSPGVSNLSFRSDLSAVDEISIKTLIKLAPEFKDLSPQQL